MSDPGTAASAHTAHRRTATVPPHPPEPKYEPPPAVVNRPCPAASPLEVGVVPRVYFRPPPALPARPATVPSARRRAMPVVGAGHRAVAAAGLHTAVHTTSTIHTAAFIHTTAAGLVGGVGLATTAIPPGSHGTCLTGATRACGTFQPAQGPPGPFVKGGGPSERS